MDGKLNGSLRILQIIIQLILIVDLSTGHREHKVHNITLYPDKHSWCHVLPIKQVISYSGCKAVEIDNNVCVGACFSYSIPHTEPSDPGEVIVPYCDSCQPSETEWRHVQLECDKNDPEIPEKLLKRVQIIKNCSCTSCEKDEYLRQKLLGHKSDDDLLQPQNDIPDLLDVLQIRNETTSNLPKNVQHSKDLKSLLNHHIITLLKNIQSDNSQKDKEQLMDALRIVQGGDNNKKINDKSIAEFVNSLNTENIELDIPRLREILTKFEHSKYYEKHRKTLQMNHFSDSIENDNDNDNDDDDVDILMRINKQKHNNIDGIEGSHLNMGHRKGSHIGMGLQQNGNNNNNDDDDDDDLLNVSIEKNHHHHHHHHLIDDVSSTVGNLMPHQNHHHHHHHHHHNHETTTSDSVSSSTSTSRIIDVLSDTVNINNENNNKNRDDDDNNNDGNDHIHHHSHPDNHHYHHNHHKHHHIGENIVDHGHLARGPHNSLVIAPDIDDTLSESSASSSLSSTASIKKHHEKLDVHAHELKPNHAGTLLTYSSHSDVGKSKN